MTVEHAVYQLALSAGYKFKITKIGFNSYDPLAYYQKENFPDVEVLRPNIAVDFNLIHQKFLMTVNGYVYPTEYLAERLYIPNATLSMVKSRDNQIGLIDLSKFGNVTKIKITNDMIALDTLQPAYEKILLTFSEDVVKPILILAGYMIFENSETFYRTSDRTFALRLDRLSFPEKLYELDRYRDIFKELEVPVSNTNGTMVDANLVRSETTIRKFLTLANSFLVNLHTSNLTVNKIYMEKTSVPLNYRTNYNPVFPLVVGYGKLTEYFRETPTEGKYTLTTQDGHYNNYLLTHMSHREIDIYNGHRQPGTTYRLSPGFFLDISTET
ncbi:hypothetical protein [Flavobacterium sp.]|jgi:hypothetical protein|uniref:hypothetical protein n=1 Tax=Flavobacterium sp. TaxID=239 RepID=UPI0037BF10E6